MAFRKSIFHTAKQLINQEFYRAEKPGQLSPAEKKGGPKIAAGGGEKKFLIVRPLEVLALDLLDQSGPIQVEQSGRFILHPSRFHESLED